MITKAQALLLTEEKAQADFPVYQPGPVLTAPHEEQCSSIRLRLYHYQQRIPLDDSRSCKRFNALRCLSPQNDE